MKRSEFIKKMPEIMEKTCCMGKFFTDPDWYVMPGDIGIYPDDTIVLDGEKTRINVKDLENILYRHDPDDDEYDENFIFFDMGDMCLYYHFECVDEYELHLKGREYTRHNTVFEIITSWDGRNPFVISERGELLAYLGDDTEIVIPSSVSTIGERFCDIRDSDTAGLTKVTLSPTVKTISEDAFVGSRLKEIDLCEVESIEEGAFWGTNIKSILLPKTLKHIGNNVFRGTSIYNINAIRNESDLELTKDVIEYQKKIEVV